MFWNKKETKNSLPDLPPISLPVTGMPSLEQKSAFVEDSESSEKHLLPSFPDSPTDKEVSQTAIKEAVENVESKQPYESSQEMNIPFYSKENNFKTVETPNSSTMLLPPPENTFTPSKSVTKNFEQEPAERKNPAIFVKIDKFNSAKRALSSAQEKLNEIEELLKRIREVKLREEQELSGWEKELSSIKIKVKEVTENIFESLE